MRWLHPEHPGRAVRLAYCMNLHAGETLAEIRDGIEAIALPLRDRLAPGQPFGVGMYLPAQVAQALSPGGVELASLLTFLELERLVPFTFNAFPYGGFHQAGLKERVYSPNWREEERAAFTLAVARVAAACTRHGLLEGVEQVSISTHAGGWGTAAEDPTFRRDCAAAMALVVEELVAIEAGGGPSIVLSLEAEPRSSANDSAALAAFLVDARAAAAARLRGGHDDDAAAALAARHLGTCLDCCHSAVEFESPAEALDLARRGGRLGKVQVSSAPSLEHPGRDAQARAAMLAMDEPRYLHQTTGRRADGALLRVDDLPDLARALEGADARSWFDCEAWRSHFHVPIDRGDVGPLGTTRDHARAVVEAALDDPGAWTGRELQLEIETYTWDVLPDPARGPGELVDGLEREWRTLMGWLTARGWKPAE